MNAQQFREEIAKAIFEKDIKISSLSDENFNTYLVAFSFKDSELQTMFHVKPLREDGTEFPEDFYFISEKRARAFMSEYHDYHTSAWWMAIKKNHHQQYSCLAQLYMVRNAMKGGEL